MRGPENGLACCCLIAISVLMSFVRVQNTTLTTLRLGKLTQKQCFQMCADSDCPRIAKACIVACSLELLETNVFLEEVIVQPIARA